MTTFIDEDTFLKMKSGLTRNPEALLLAIKAAIGKAYISDEQTQVLLLDGFPVREAVKIQLESYDGTNKFLLSLGHKVRKYTLTPRQVRAAVNALRDDYNERWKPIEAAAPPERPLIKCYKCDAMLPTWDTLKAHKLAEHPRTPDVIKCRGCDFEAPDWASMREHRKTHYEPLFEHTTPSGLNLEDVPDGRYATPLVKGGKLYKTAFMSISTVKRDTTRTRKYRFGWKTYGTEEVKAGTREVRFWHGDAKELIGEQRPGESYRGDFEQVILRIIFDPSGCQKLFGLTLGKCGSCGRSLTDPVSRKHGVGPECIRKPFWASRTTFAEADVSEDELASRLGVVLTPDMEALLGRSGSTA
jgi:hypothetical protein